MNKNPFRQPNIKWHLILDAIERTSDSPEFKFVRPTTVLDGNGHGRAFDPERLEK